MFLEEIFDLIASIMKSLEILNLSICSSKAIITNSDTLSNFNPDKALSSIKSPFGIVSIHLGLIPGNLLELPAIGIISLIYLFFELHNYSNRIILFSSRLIYSHLIFLAII